MKALIAGAAVAAMFATTATADFYVIQEPTTKHCRNCRRASGSRYWRRDRRSRVWRPPGSRKPYADGRSLQRGDDRRRRNDRTEGAGTRTLNVTRPTSPT